MEPTVAAHPEAKPDLARAFASFTAAASELEFCYQTLQKEVVQLRKELRRQDAALRASLEENRYMREAQARLLDSLPCGVLVIAQDGSTVFSNPEARRLLRSSERPGESGDMDARVCALLDETAEARAHTGEEHEIRIAGPQGERWLSVRRKKLQGTGLNPNAVGKDHRELVLIVADKTAQKEVEREREAREHLTVLAEMSSVLAHEIRNPIASMELLTGLLAGDDGLSLEQKNWVASLQAGVRSLSATVNNVLRFHTLNSPAYVAIELSRVLADTVQFAEPLAREAGIRTDLIDKTGSRRVLGSGSELQQVFLNLCTNTFHHTALGGRLTIRAHVVNATPKPTARIEFSDTGTGIEEQDLPRIFDPGFSTGAQNLGLGLAISKRIIEQHRGTIEARSQVGKGTTITIELPIL